MSKKLPMTKMGRVILFIAFYFLIIVILIIGKMSNLPIARCEKSEFILGSTHISLIGVARTAAERERGLSGHAPFAADEGMLFLFDDRDVKKFWMKDMLFPIDIIWISPEWKVNGWAAHALPESYPTLFPSPDNTQFVLEVSAGTVERLKLSTGTPTRILPCEKT